ncbi:MAG: hypothetical protein IT176_15795 [Acidobacteria bacterium]|nr:hypothetical protein [Acidobacteriota bacterium]
MRFQSPARAHRLLIGPVLLLLLLTTSNSTGVGQSRAPIGFATRVAQLSESGGYFDTDNLISNETSYLHVIPALGQMGVKGGAYIVVGPDQNFSYIARIRPAIAFIIDVRRDNLLLQLLFKALFSMADTRAEYISLLFGRTPPPRTDIWKAAEIDSLATYVDGKPPGPASAQAAIDGRVDRALDTFGVPLTSEDRNVIHDFHHRFISAGLGLKFESKGRSPRSYYPTYRELLLETDRQGHQLNFLASESDYEYVRWMQAQDLIIPVVGDLAGPSAINAISRFLRERGEQLSAFYVSNVEFYLFGDGKYPQFIDNLKGIPRAPNSVLIRSVFGKYISIDTMPGYFSTQMVQPIDALVSGDPDNGYRSYYSVITAGRRQH